MRRSLAPSQKLHTFVAKKPKLSSNGCTEEIENNNQIDNVTAKNTLLDTLKAIRRDNSVGEVDAIEGSKSDICNVGISLDKEFEKESEFSVGSLEYTRKDTVEEANSTGAGSSVNISLRPTTKPPKFCPPTRFVPPLLSCASFKANTDQPDHSTETAHYYSVIWCKKSNKKHKKWEGDAILITKGKGASLKDMEGKDIGKGTGYKAKELASLVEGSSLLIGGKEIEVMGSIKEEDWLSGKCFVSCSSTSSSVNRSDVKSSFSSCAVKKGFTNPMIGASSTKLHSQAAVPVPYYNPDHPSALVLPRPPSSHQHEHNRAGLAVVDVVVDPHLVSRLRPHQKEGVTFLYECVMGFRDYQGCGIILADDMGLGKTVQCITLLWTLLKQGAYGGKPVMKRALVVTPGSLVKNWCKEFNKWLGCERINVFAVTSEKRPSEYVNSKVYPVMIISYEMFMRCYDSIKDIHFDIIICDEGHRLKNSSTKATTMLASLPVRRRIVLTGTPIQNDLQEFYSIVEFCNPGILGSASAFHKVYEEPIIASRQPTATATEKVMGEARANQLNDLISLFFLRRTQDVNTKYLPDKIERVVFCKPTPLQLILYRHILSSRMVQSCLLGGGYGGRTCPHLQCLTLLKKLCNSPSLVYPKEDEPADIKDLSLGNLFPPDWNDDNFVDCGKLQVVDKMLYKLHSLLPSKDKIVLVSNFTKTLDLLQRLCELRHYKFLRLDGSTAVDRRLELVDRFNNGYCNETVFLLSSKAGGVGLNLVGASQLILYDIEWNPANDIQAMARVWRDGQKKKVFIYRLLTTGTVEEKIYQRQVSKLGLSEAVVDTDQSLHTTSFSKEELKDLFSLDESTMCNTHDLLNCTCLQDQQADTSCSMINNCTQSSLSMDHLLQWTHHSTVTPIGDRDLLGALDDGITFIFTNEVTNH
ncbi:DNA repair and recombination protein RAD54B-like isoform X2 [Dysidea avara]|uniref:DNA repair and recombination protein RAD54B-like isoform X2 n=1 Tax=Dysidea avara TaxID=196820 RepID=UPI0033318CBE